MREATLANKLLLLSHLLHHPPRSSRFLYGKLVAAIKCQMYMCVVCVWCACALVCVLKPQKSVINKNAVCHANSTTGVAWITTARPAPPLATSSLQPPPRPSRSQHRLHRSMPTASQIVWKIVVIIYCRRYFYVSPKS